MVATPDHVRDTLSGHGDLDLSPEGRYPVMTSYGYRLFSMQLTRGFGRKPVDFSECNGEHFVDIAERLLENLKNTVVGSPNLRDDDPPLDTSTPSWFGTPALQVLELNRGVNMIRADAFKGIFGQHNKALAIPGTSSDVDMTDLAAARVYRIILVFPESGDTGVAAMETIGRSCPIGLLQKWMARQSKSDSHLRERQIKDQTGRIERVPWWKLNFRQMADEEHLQELITSGKLGKIQLAKMQVSPDRKREVEKFRLTSSRVEGALAVEIGRVLADWWERIRRTDDHSQRIVTPKEGASQLAMILGEEVNDLDFDDGWIVIKDEGGEKKVRPSRMPELFTYFIDDLQPKRDEIYCRAREKFSRLRESSQIDVEWPPLQSEE